MKKIFLCAAFAMGLMTGPVEASYCAYWRTAQVGEWPFYSYRRVCGHWVREETTRVYAYSRRLTEIEEDHANCLWQFPAIRATGDDKLEEERAQVSAQDRWSIEVETRHGTRFSDIRYAARATSSCARKVPTSATANVQATLGIRHFSCVYEAVPCAAPKLPVDEDTRGKRASEKREEAVRKLDPRADYYEPEPPKKRRWYWRRVPQ